MAVCQSPTLQLTLRYREQARSHKSNSDAPVQPAGVSNRIGVPAAQANRSSIIKE